MVSTRSAKGKAKTTIVPAKAKNKVGSPPSRKFPAGRVTSPPPRSDLFGEEESVGSDEANYEDEESTSPEPPSDSDASTSSRKRLPRHLLQQLGLDIQARGGIQVFRLQSHFPLRALCDQRTELYGQKGSDLRLRIGRKVARWQKLSQAEFNKTLLELGLDAKDIKLPKQAKPAAKKSEPEVVASKAENSEPAEAELPAIPDPVPSSVSFPTRAGLLLLEEESAMSVGGSHSIPIGAFVVETVLFCDFATD